MALAMRKAPKQLPEHLHAAIGEGYLTQEQLRELIAFEADMLDLGYDEAVQRAYADTLPRNSTGADLRLLVSMLAG